MTFGFFLSSLDCVALTMLVGVWTDGGVDLSHVEDDGRPRLEGAGVAAVMTEAMVMSAFLQWDSGRCRASWRR